MNGFSYRTRLTGFRHAFNGLIIFIREEHNSRIHLSIASVAIILGILLGISNWEWVAIAFAIGWVIAAEIINSAIESLSDFVSPDRNDSIRKVKDLSAAAVLISSIAALVVGVIVFGPRVIELIESL